MSGRLSPQSDESGDTADSWEMIEHPDATTDKPNSSPKMSDPVKILITGDSMTHGGEGDATWRYRLWHWLKNTSGPKVKFVGPFIGTQDPDAPKGPQPPQVPGEPEPENPPRASGEYAKETDPEWNRDGNSAHFSAWGYAAWQCRGAIFEQVEKYQPHYLLVALGFNDMGWCGADADAVLDTMKGLVEEARKARGDVRVVLATIPQRTFIGREELVENTDEFNRRLHTFVVDESTKDSPIKVAEFQKWYGCGRDACPAGYDGLHPNALGEYQIAKAFSEALQAFWLRSGNDPLRIPDPVEEPPFGAVANLVAEGAPMGVRVTWNPLFGSRGYLVRARIADSGQGWSEARAGGPRYDTTFTDKGIKWEYLVRGVRGASQELTTPWSKVATAVSRRDTAPPPRDIKVVPTEKGCELSWRPPKGDWDVERYEVSVLDKDTPGAFFQSWGARGNTATISNLEPSHRYDVWMCTWCIIDGESAGGLPGSARPIRPGVPSHQKLGPPVSLTVEAQDDTTVKLGWDEVPAAAAYEVYVRNRIDSNEDWRLDGDPVKATEHSISSMSPTVSDFEFRIIAVNGDLESEPSSITTTMDTQAEDDGS